jgi:ribosomal protein S18 acetylase RimI-like enzyme
VRALVVSAGRVLEAARGLSPEALRALADLEQRTIAVDGGRLKLEWSSLRGRSGDKLEDFLWWDGDRLLGFAGIYAHGGPNAELAGMVDPAARRGGIATALLDAALAQLLDSGHDSVLLITPRSSVGGQALAAKRNAVLDHSEHALVLHGEPTPGRTDPAITLRNATNDDVPEIKRIFDAAFDWTPPDLFDRLSSPTSWTVLAERDGRAVGTLRASLHDDVGAVHGFAVDPPLQGKGIGRDVLRRTCHDLREQGAERVELEVDVANENALGLYTSLGFEPVISEDYYSVSCRPE